MPKPKWPMFLIVLGVLTMPAMAQTDGQPIIFSSPQSDEGPKVKSSLEPIGSEVWQLTPTTAAPLQLFDFTPPNDSVSQPVSPGISVQRQQMRQLPNDLDDWIFMTPEEILGVKKTKSKLEPPTGDAFGGEDNLTQVERYLQRKSQLHGGPTNGWDSGRGNLPWNLPRDADNTSRPDISPQNTVETARSLRQILTGERAANYEKENGASFGWDTFQQPTVQTLKTPNPDQIASMERFRQLLNNAPVNAVNATQITPASQFITASEPLIDPLLTQPGFVPNPAGSSFTPLSSGISRPTGLTPLPQAVKTVASPVTPVRKLQPAPWLLQGPQPFVMPQPKGF